MRVLCFFLSPLALWSSYALATLPHSIQIDPEAGLRNATIIVDRADPTQLQSNLPVQFNEISEAIDLDLGYCDYVDLKLSIAGGFEGDLLLLFGVEEDAGLIETRALRNKPFPENLDTIDRSSGRVIRLAGSDLLTDGQAHTYRIDLGLHPHWRGRFLRKLALISPSEVRLHAITIGDDPETVEPILHTEEINYHEVKKQVPWDDSWRRLESKHGVVIWDDHSLSENLPNFLKRGGPLSEEQMQAYARATLRMIEESFQIYHKKLGYNPPFYRDRTDDPQAYKTMCTTWYGGFWMGATRGGLPYFNVGVGGMLDEGWGNPVPHEYAHCFQGGQKAILRGEHWESHANYLREMRNAHFFEVAGGSAMPGKSFRRSNITPDHGYHIYGDYRIHLGLGAIGESIGSPELVRDLWNQGDEKQYVFDKLRYLNGPEASKDTIAAAYARAMMMDVPSGEKMLRSAQIHGVDGISNRPWFELQQGSNLERLADINGEARPYPYRVPLSRAPMPFAYMWHKLTPTTPGSGTVSVRLRGLLTAENDPDDWRFLLIATSGDGSGTARYSKPYPPDETGSIDLEPGETEVRLLVASTPDMASPDTKLYQDQADWGRDARFRRYPYELAIIGAEPALHRFETDPELLSGFRKHGRGGGLVSPQAEVDASAFVGPNALILAGATVSDEAVIDDYAVVGEGGRVSETAVIRGFASVRKAQVQGHALIDGHASADGGLVEGNARLLDHSLIISKSAILRDDSYVVGTAHLIGKDVVAAGDTVIEFDAANTGTRETGFIFNSIPWGGWFEPYRATLTKERGLLAAYPITRTSGEFLEAHRGAGHSILENNPRREQNDERNSLVLTFGGVDQSVTLNRRFAAARNFTFASWVSSERKADQPVLAIGNGRGDSLELNHRNSQNRVEVTLKRGNELIAIEADHASDRSWEHLAVVLGEGKLRLYINGRLVGEKAAATEIYQIAPKAAGIETNLSFLGRSIAGTHFSGSLDNIKFFNQCLDSERITEAMGEDISPRTLYDFRAASKE
ncbi:MAG: LamG-like jellyroll fold domain-containing protein [Verrucomicrobiota bacterium]